VTTPLLERLKGVRRSGEGWSARCPAHEDKQNSLSIGRREDRWLVKCHAGCDFRDIVAAIDIDAADLFDGNRGGGRGGTAAPSGNRATAQPRSTGLTLQGYAIAKQLPLEFLKACGLSDLTYDGSPAVRIPYYGETGEELAVRFRIALDGDRFRWKSGTRPCLYGLNRISEARKAGYVVLVEGESDCHTLWFHGIPALGIPGATNWREDRDARHLDGMETIYVVLEPDRGGEAVRRWLSTSSIRHRVKLIRLPVKDPSALHLENPDQFKTCWQTACSSAVPWKAVEAEASAKERSEAWSKCSELAQEANILDGFDYELSRLGVVGERRAAKLIYLALTSRLLDRPVSVVVKGPSSGGKSFIVESTLKFFPASAFYALTAMSERSLVYSSEPLRHRHLVVYEAAGLDSELMMYLIRSLLSEGRLRYETVEKSKDGLVPRLIEREGPTGLILTTTRLRLHPENETRMLSLTITDTREQTKAVLRALAQGNDGREPDLSRWHFLQAWLALEANRVLIPFANHLADLIPPAAVRLRRDFKTVLTLIRAHALLHQASRKKDAGGQVIAEVGDYEVVRELVADLVAVVVDATVKPEVREVVQAVDQLIRSGKQEVHQSDLKSALRLDKSAISRRVADALDGGFLRNLEERRGRPAKLTLGEPLPADVEVLPQSQQLAGGDRLHGCTVVPGSNSPPPPQHTDQQAHTPRASASASLSEINEVRALQPEHTVQIANDSNACGAGTATDCTIDHQPDGMPDLPQCLRRRRVTL
jgi:hypothetical protein